MKYQRISADGHLDLIWLPADLFTSQASSAMKERMPFVADGPEGLRWTNRRGTVLGWINGVGASGKRHIPGLIHRADRMAEAGLYRDGDKGIRRPGTPELRARDMALDGVDAEAIYGILAIAAKHNDPEADREMLRIYNDWLNDFCSHDPDRHIGLACLPQGDVQAAADEVRRVAKMGYKGVELSLSLDMQPMWDPCWDLLWQTIDEVNLPLHFHAFPTFAQMNKYSLSGEMLIRQRFTGLAMFQMRIGSIITDLMAAAVFERFPRMRVAFGESGVGWIPYLLNRMDTSWKEQFKNTAIRRPPSEYWREHCRATFQYDEIGLKLIDEMGAESLMWGSDYPHMDGIWPDSSELIAKQCSGLPAEVTHMITCENARKFYNLPAS